ncbi:MAG: hypothetical protein LBU23_08910 [Planctomycetota bacterium]|jgi:hypothetical protein|nr:hypothetical protein [Planctomycetota bacterium]
MQAVADVMNLALANLANLNFIQAPGEDSPEGEQMTVRWELALEGLLLEHPWSFAGRSQALAKLADSAADFTSSGLYYAYPADCLRIRRVWTAGLERFPLAFGIGLSEKSGRKAVIVFASGETILPYALYTTKSVAVPAMPSDFVSALAWRLAGEIALAKRADPELANAAMGAYRLALGRARLHDARERSGRPPPYSKWREARFG